MGSKTSGVRGEKNPAKRKEVRDKISRAKTGKKFSLKHRISMSLSRGGNGKSMGRYKYYRAFSKIKNTIKRRDSYTCCLCGIKPEELDKYLSVHHIDYNPENNAPVNLITLCVSCHSHTNGFRHVWRKHFESLIGER